MSFWYKKFSLVSSFLPGAVPQLGSFRQLRRRSKALPESAGPWSSSMWDNPHAEVVRATCPEPPHSKPQDGKGGKQKARSVFRCVWEDALRAAVDSPTHTPLARTQSAGLIKYQGRMETVVFPLEGQMPWENSDFYERKLEILRARLRMAFSVFPSEHVVLLIRS